MPYIRWRHCSANPYVDSQSRPYRINKPGYASCGDFAPSYKVGIVFEHLRYIVIDELHTYRGVFGSHVANVIARLKRICAYYGANPQFICTSATIANPKELAQELTGSTFDLIDDNGAPRGKSTSCFTIRR